MALNTVPLGVVLEEALRSACTEVVLVAPFIKAPVLERLLHHIRPEIDLAVITRWRADEVAAGVSDLATYDLLASRQHSTLFLCNSLHAKFYRADSTLLIGSANLTATALGWVSKPNFELLVDASALSLDYSALETAWKNASVRASVDIQTIVQAAAASLSGVQLSAVRKSFDKLESAMIVSTSEEASPNMAWLPHTRHPEYLFDAYSGNTERLSKEGARQCAIDLEALSVPSGMTAEQFRLAVRAALFQVPLIAEIDGLVTTPTRFGAIRNLMARYLHHFGDQRDPSSAWQTLMRWLLYYFDERYDVSRPRHSEIFHRLDVPNA